MNKENSCCFIGHKKIEKSEELKKRVYDTIENLIINENIEIFYLGSKSEFNSLCETILCELKEKYPHITRIYIRAEYPYLSDDYKEYLLNWCDDTYYPEKILNAGKLVYVERNFIMIDKSKYCVFYFSEDYIPQKRPTKIDYYLPQKRKSGTLLAYEYAIKKKKKIINTF